MQGDQTTSILIIAAAVVIVLLAIWWSMRRKRTEALRERYGDEYDRTLEDAGSRTDAEKNLAEREKRVSDLKIRPLTLAERDRFADEWRDVKALFVDSPAEAVLRGDRLLGTMMQTRGFPMGDFDRRYEDLTVNHADVARHYRAGHDVALKRNDATTEEMRRALKEYEHLYDELVRDAGTSVEETRAAVAAGTLTSGAAAHDENAATSSGAPDTDGDGTPHAIDPDADGDDRSDHVTQTLTPDGRPTKPPAKPPASG